MIDSKCYTEILTKVVNIIFSPFSYDLFSFIIFSPANFLTVLESGAPLSSFLEGALYKSSI